MIVHFQHIRQRSGRTERNMRGTKRQQCTQKSPSTWDSATTQVSGADLQAVRLKVHATGDLQGEPVLQNNTVLPKASTWCHSSEFSKAKGGIKARDTGKPQSKRMEKLVSHWTGGHVLFSRAVVVYFTWLLKNKQICFFLHNLMICGEKKIFINISYN